MLKAIILPKKYYSLFSPSFLRLRVLHKDFTTCIHADGVACSFSFLSCLLLFIDGNRSQKQVRLLASEYIIEVVLLLCLLSPTWWWNQHFLRGRTALNKWMMILVELSHSTLSLASLFNSFMLMKTHVDRRWAKTLSGSSTHLSTTRSKTLSYPSVNYLTSSY